MKTKSNLYSIAAAVITLAAQSAFAIVSGATWTTNVSGERVNQNIYDAKCDVYLSGGPGNGQNNELIDGDYYYQVTDTSGKTVLSTSLAANRTITVYGGVVVGSVPMCDPDPYDSSGNGVYKAWLIRAYAPDCVVSFVGREFVVTNSQGNDAIESCSKTDNFKIGPELPPPPPPECDPNNPPLCGCDGSLCSPGFDPTVSVSKTANGFYDEKWPWSIGKSACLTGGTGCVTQFNQVGGSVSFSYVLTLTVGNAIRKNNDVSGTIIITASPGSTGGLVPQEIPVNGISATDTIAYGIDRVNDLNANCVIEPYQSSSNTVQSINYLCTYDPDAPADLTGGFNQVQVTTTNAGSADAVAAFNFTKADDIDACVTVTDTFNNSLTPETIGTACLADTVNGVKTFPYTRLITPPRYGCVTVPNIAQFAASGTTAETPLQTGSSPTRNVTVCGPVRSGAHTMGFWQNKNGQGIITGGAFTPTVVGTKTYNVCNVGTWLRTNFAPFSDLSPTATCAQVGAYVTNVIKSASAGVTMSAMLKGQMLATALSVYFSSTTGLGGNQLGAFNGGPDVGNKDIDITKVCKNIATCTIYDYNADEVFGYTHNTVMQLLVTASGPGIWGSGVRATQETAKNVFDAINNSVAFGYTP